MYTDNIIRNNINITYIINKAFRPAGARILIGNVRGTLALFTLHSIRESVQTAPRQNRVHVTTTKLAPAARNLHKPVVLYHTYLHTGIFTHNTHPSMQNKQCM